MRTTTLALVAMAAQSAAQAAWDGSTKPRMESAGGDLTLHTHDDVNINFRGRAEGQGVTASLYDLVQGQGTLTTGQASLLGSIEEIRRDMRKCTRPPTANAIAMRQIWGGGAASDRTV